MAACLCMHVMYCKVMGDLIGFGSRITIQICGEIYKPTDMACISVYTATACKLHLHSLELV